MSKHRRRHERAYAAGARDACEAVKESLRPLLPIADRARLDRVIDHIKASRFPVPEPEGKGTSE